jgi:membrane-bound serine protease (ClpP class)
MTGKEGLVGEIGRVIGDLDPEGKVVVHGEYWDARSVGGTVSSGSKVRVVTVYDRALDVTAVDDNAEGSS